MLLVSRLALNVVSYLPTSTKKNENFAPTLTSAVCGDVGNLLVASVPFVNPNPLEQGGWQYQTPPTIVDDSQCTVPCSGNPEYLCGANNLLSYYTWDGPSPLYEFGFPQGTAAGEYSFLIGGLTVPLITSQLVTGKVSFVQKTFTGFTNGTGVYELDLTQIDNFDAAWRTM